MVKPVLGKKGITLIELIIATFLSSLIFVASASFYVSGLENWNQMKKTDDINSYLLVNAISKYVHMSSELSVYTADGQPCLIAQPGAQLNLRLDYSRDKDRKLVANSTVTTADDTQIQFRFMNNKIYYKETYPVPSSPAMLQQSDTLFLDNTYTATGSFVPLNNGSGNPIMVQINVLSNGKNVTTTSTALAAPK